MHKTSLVLANTVVLVGLGAVVELVVPTLVPCASAESLNVKPGAWEMTVTMVATGMKLSPEMAAKMTPLQHA
jgi:hypothetical protein